MVVYFKGWQDFLIFVQMVFIYWVFFWNIIQDSVIRVIVCDMLFEGLDIFILEFGVSSYFVIYDIYENGVIKVIFENLELLVDGISFGDYVFFEYYVV